MPVTPATPDVPAAAVTREQDIRRRAIDATRALAAEGGYDSVQMRDVVRLSKLSSATIYRHFSSKDHLLAATHQEWIAALERSDAARPHGADAAERVCAILHNTCRTMARHPRLTAALIHALGSSDPGVGDCHREINHTMNTMLRTAIADEIPNADEFVRLLGVAWEGALFSWAFGRMTMEAVEHTVTRSARVLLLGAAAEAAATARHPNG
ncbi:TetR/AcrR family transcriptional regulator [Streptomyces sp. SID3343]|uniref:TetR/AcrR family transcriptional regulator n=1 Tax=Streptomyces sp. SID3343 TaxID=2690260 RepID=UPI001369596C|nr:TetR/AcrR family transcriptional regulator [Streptomyces sp. SID3343]MYV96886.1 TetR family transcriptional regulator [Streptomyces sp. SID3343]